jgi:hypothetical protein
MNTSQNSQMSSMEMFSQQKGPIPSKFDQYQRSQSQTTEVQSRFEVLFFKIFRCQQKYTFVFRMNQQTTIQNM